MTRGHATGPGTTAPLKGEYVDLLRDGPQAGAEPRTACLRYACAAINAGHSLDDYIDAMLDHRNRLGRYYRQHENGRRRTERDTYDNLVRDWNKEVRYVADHPTIRSKPEAYQRLGEIRAAAQAWTWRGRGGLRNKTVLLALLTIGDSRGTVTPRVSVRTLCEDTPYASMDTILNAIAALTELGWITPDRRGMERTESTIYGLDIPPRPSARPEHEDPALTPAVLDRVVHSDVALGMALGVHAAAVHATLHPTQAQSVAEVVTASGVSRRTAYNWLPRLEKLGLAISGPDGWLAGSGKPAEVAADLHVDEQVERRETRHKLQREGFYAWVEARSVDVSSRGGGHSR